MNLLIVFACIFAIATAAPQGPVQTASVLIPQPGGGGCVRCTNQASFRTQFDFRNTFVQCGNMNQASCPGCCGAYALWLEKSTDESVGFVFNGRCTCCTSC
ncbi:hypothetical protein Tcan_09000 [Toxocara canis]|uniref:Uncharacterized protein n=1 Tax=Toxocara canis TaxID=6265 RepID=A0A0B2VMF9_TOXCA|nr:hypothetical protein Tcan_09000 [Toxocara canis]